MTEADKGSILEKLRFLYEDRAEEIMSVLEDLLKQNHSNSKAQKSWVDESTAMLITYGDSLGGEEVAPLTTLTNFLKAQVGDAFSAVHILPMYPYTSDDGFSVMDYRKIDEQLGNWEAIHQLSKDYELMFDGVINHISKQSEWFMEWQKGNEAYKDYFITCDPALDYSKVTRPRALPLLTPFETSEGLQYVWTTFSEDQIDLNFQNPKVLIEIVELLIFYANNGARFIRLDAIGFAWKILGTTCMHLPQTHTLIQLLRELLDLSVPGTLLITETNVPHIDNISYFGNGHKEAHMVYQFPLPPLTLYTFIKGDATKLTQWAEQIQALAGERTYFNFLASHDGIGLKPLEGILSSEEIEIITNQVLAHGGRINYKTNADGTVGPYEMNINYQDALTAPEAPEQERIEKFLAAQVILLSVVGVPGIYIHSLLGSRNWIEGVLESGINRRINREKLIVGKLQDELEEKGRSVIFETYKSLLRLRKTCKAFHPNAEQQVLYLDSRIFALIRHNKEANSRILVLINVSKEMVVLVTEFVGRDLIQGKAVDKTIVLKPYEYLWVLIK